MSWEFFLLSGWVGCGIIFVMKLESQGILINLKPFGNNDCIASVFTADYGLISGLMKGALVAKKINPWLHNLEMLYGMHVWILSWEHFIGKQQKIWEWMQCVIRVFWDL
ncbi:MAG: recombination protein O N-terminal domain-containing protein [Alphaproteobacteria bacterium]